MKITNPEALMAASISRRSLVKTSAIGSLALASSAFTLPFSRIAHAAADLASGNVAEKRSGVHVPLTAAAAACCAYT